MRVRTVIADDEALARMLISSQLNLEPDFEVVAEAKDGPETVRLVESLRPDLLFLDIRMPGFDGFQVLNELSGGPAPVVIFTTAYDRFAIRAFEAQAKDYLLKPFTRKRFLESLESAKRQLELLQAYKELTTSTVPGHHQPSSSSGAVAPAADRVIIRHRRETMLVDLNEVEWVEACQNYLTLHVGTESYMARMTILQLLTRLPPQHFVRIHRSIVVNVLYIDRLVTQGHSDYLVVLKRGTPLKLSRHYRSLLFSSLRTHNEPTS